MRRIGTILAERRAGRAGHSGKVVRVSLGAPRPRTEDADWECPFRIHGAGVSRVEFGYGIDSMQALTTALDGIRVLLDESGLAFGWKLGRRPAGLWHGETGFARSIPIVLGPTIEQRLERLFDARSSRETQRLGAGSTRKSKPTSRAVPSREERKAR